MAFPSITDFKEQLQDGGARPSLFKMQIVFPENIVKSIAAVSVLPAMYKFEFHCRLSQIPGTSHNPIVVKFAGREVKYAGQRVFQNLNVTILNDEAFTVRRGLEAWFEAMNTRESNKTKLFAPTNKGYAGTGTIFQYKKDGKIARAYRLVDMFPVTLGEVALDWANDGAIEDYTCEFAYQYWEPDRVNSAAVPGILADHVLDPLITI